MDTPPRGEPSRHPAAGGGGGSSSDDATLGSLLAERAASTPGLVVADLDDGLLTYRELHESSLATAEALQGLGVAPGDRVATMLPTGRAALATWMGAALAGGVEVPVNAAYRGVLLGELLSDSGARVLVIDESLLDRLGGLEGSLPALEHVVVAPSTPDGLGRDPSAARGGSSGRRFGGATVHDLARLCEATSATPAPVAVSPSDHSVILYTSGTTGPSKGVVLTHRANFTLAGNVNSIMEYTAEDVLFNAFPLFHVNARYTGLLCSMLAGGSIVLRRRFSASGFWQTCRERGVTAFNFMGSMLVMLHKQPERPDDAEHGVTRAYGAPAPLEIYADFERRFHVKLVEVYGSTECGTVTVSTVRQTRPGSCGRASPYYEVAVLDEDGEVLPPGEPGEIAVRPRRAHVMFEHYHNKAEATVEAFRGLWFHTGDRGCLDGEGWLWYLDRTRDSIRRRGENISSYEVERAALTHEGVAEAAAVGIRDEVSEEEVLLVVVARGEQPSPESVLDACAAQLPHFAVPRYVRFADELPRTPSQRIEKFKLRELGLTPDTWDRERAGYEVRR